MTYGCRAGRTRIVSRTVVYQDGGRQVVEVPAWARSADEERVVLASNPNATPRIAGTFILDLDRLTVSRIADPPSQWQSALEAGLVVWTSEEPSGDRQHTRPVWNVARID